MNKLLLVLALAASPIAASATELSYSYVEGGYARVTLDGIDGDLDFDGYQLRGSAAVAENIYLFGGYGSATNDDFNGVDLDFNELQVGVGYRHGLSERADFIAELGYVNQELEFEGESFDVDAGRLSAGFRGLLTDNFEGVIKASYTDGNQNDGDFSVTAGAQFKFNPTWGVIGEVEAAEDATKYLVGVRASF